jgi:transcriptional regulator with XRE-family HTH domain
MDNLTEMFPGDAQSFRVGANSLQTRPAILYLPVTRIGRHGGKISLIVILANKKIQKSVVFPERLKKLMEDKGLTQQKLADMAGVSQPTVVKWLDGTLPNGINFSNLASANGVSVDWFFEFDPNKVVDNIPQVRNNSSVNPILPALIERLKKATEPRGKKTELAEFLSVSLPRISEWLSGDREPGGETTLQMLQWVTAQERKT